MGLFIKESSSKLVDTGFVRSNNNYNLLNQIYYKENGIWYPIWKYNWVTGEWSDCNVSCGVGEQTRSVTCNKIHNNSISRSVDDSFCIKNVGSKPSTTQQCDMGSCNPCELKSTQLEYSVSFSDDINGGKGTIRNYSFNSDYSGRYKVMLCIYIQPPTSGKSGISKCAHFVGVCVNTQRGISGDCTTNNGDGMINLPVNRIDLLTAGSINYIQTQSPVIAYVSLDLGIHNINAGNNYFSVTTNTQTDTSVGVFGIFSQIDNHGIKLQKVQ